MKKFVLTFIAAVFLSAAPALLASPSYYLQGKGVTKLNATDLVAAAATMGVQVKPLSGTSTDGNGTFTFPIVGGGIDAGTFVFEAVHTGGITLTDGTNTVTLNSPIINTTETQPILTMLVTMNGSLQGRFAVGDVQVPALTPTITNGTKVKIRRVTITLSALAASLLNQEYSTSSFAAGQPLATATIKLFAGNQLP